MIFLRRFSGILLILVGAAGVFACGVAIFKMGNAEKQLRRFTGQTFDSTENALQDIRERLNQIALSVAHVRASLQSAPSQSGALSADGIQDKDLAEVQVLGSDFKEAIQKIENRLIYYEEKAIWWIHLGTILIPLLLVWMGAGQVALIVLGGRLCMRRGK